MKPYLFAIHTTLFFALIIVVVVVAAMLWFVHMAGHDVVDDIGTLRSYQGVEIAKDLEGILADLDVEKDRALLKLPAVETFLAEQGQIRNLRLRLREKGQFLETQHRRGSDPRSWTVTVQGRDCLAYGAPVFEAWVPVEVAEKTLAYLLVRGSLHSREFYLAFHDGLLWIGAIALLCSIGLALYVTAPLRRMSRSMDRVAAGDLEHRVAVRGRNEVAAMGRSFNTMADRIQSMLTEQKELMAGVSHELRSPLTRMKLVLELLRGDETGESKTRIQDLESEIDTLDTLVEELLLASRFELGTVPLKLEDLVLADLIREAWTRVRESAQLKGIILSLDPTSATTVVHADRSLMVRVLGNLFENSVRYAGRGKVEISSEKKILEGRGERVEIRCSDEGPGVAESDLGRLFEPFYRVDRSRSRETGASGLGLMIVRRAIEAQGGTVKAAQGPGGQGLCISFDLPAPPRSSTRPEKSYSVSAR